MGVAEALRTAARRRRDAEAGARAGGAGAGVDEALGGIEAEADELPGGAESVAWLGAFEVALHRGDEESDDESTVLGLLADDVGERLRRNPRRKLGHGWLIGL